MRSWSDGSFRSVAFSGAVQYDGVNIQGEALAKAKTLFFCQNCGHQSPKWLGRCPECGEWSSFIEESVRPSPEKNRWGLSPTLLTEGWLGGEVTGPLPIGQVSTSAQARMTTGSPEVDRVLGGGVVPGSVILIGGDPGIGKSTLLLQLLQQLAQRFGKILYVSGEESPAQIRMRGDRLGASSESLFVVSETAFNELMRHVEKVKPLALAVDSIQTVFTDQISSAPGSVSQIREVAAQLMFFAKKSGVAVFLVGHVTKEGTIAGPRVLEHIVDTVLYFEGDKGHPYRILRAVKNRFGSTNEIGVFEMKGNGLIEVENPSGLFLAERPKDAAGSVVVAAQEGTRPILVELQALVSPSHIGMARRTALGVDSNRVSLLLAVLDKRIGLNLSGMDVFVNVVSGIEVDEPAIDLGIVAAVASSLRDRPIDSKTVVFGEVGLAGEIRGIQQPEMRLKEAVKLGFRRCLLPRRNLEYL
ncbi:MAG TPA: DNA repair protein RadA, partial [Nitrospiria bacterium]|nr:DNA repair protein RadA [Nitrospiria bacterium]